MFTVVGLYETGLQEFDGEFVFCAFHHLQELSGWGIKARIRVSDALVGDLPGMREVDVAATGGQDRLRYALDGRRIGGAGAPCVAGPRPAQVVVSDGGETLPDTAWVTWDAASGERPEVRLAGGSSDRYVGGFELRVKDYDALWTVSDSVFFAVPYDLDVRSVVDDHPEMFQWLAMLDFNVELIIGLMVLIAILNMASALLLLMLERTRSIGLLKAVGMADGPLMGVFVRLAVRILVAGLGLGQRLGFRVGFAPAETGWMHWMPGVITCRRCRLKSMCAHRDGGAWAFFWCVQWPCFACAVYLASGPCGIAQIRLSGAGIFAPPNPAAMIIHENILGAIGNTPMIRLNKVAADFPCPVLAKVEYFNPATASRTAWP